MTTRLSSNCIPRKCVPTLPHVGPFRPPPQPSARGAVPHETRTCESGARSGVAAHARTTHNLSNRRPSRPPGRPLLQELGYRNGLGATQSLINCRHRRGEQSTCLPRMWCLSGRWAHLKFLMQRGAWRLLVLRQCSAPLFGAARRQGKHS